MQHLQEKLILRDTSLLFSSIVSCRIFQNAAILLQCTKLIENSTKELSLQNFDVFFTIESASC